MIAIKAPKHLRVVQDLRTNIRAVAVLVSLLFLLWLVVLLPPSLRQSATFIFVVWAILVPLAYFSLGETRSGVPPLLELPRTPVGFHWEQPRARRPPKGSRPHGPEDFARDIWKFLRKNGYSSIGPSQTSSLAETPDGKRILVRVCTETAGVLACQDTMREMIRSGVREAILFAPKGSTRGARRFVRAIRSKRRLRIHIWHQLKPGPAQERTREKA